MNFAVDYMFRLAPRGGAGLACDETGVALGAADLARVHLEAGGRRRCEVRPPGDIGRVLKAAYGPQPDAVVQRLYRGLNRTAKWLEAGDLCHAGVEAVMLGFPDLTPTAMAKLAELADLEKRGQAWEDEPRLPAGQSGGGQWTTGGGGAAVRPPAKPGPASPSTPSARREQPVQTLDDGSYGPAAASPTRSSNTQQLPATLNDGVYHFTEGQGPGGEPAIWDDGVYRPGTDQPSAFAAALPPEVEDEAPGILVGREAEGEGMPPFLANEFPAEVDNVEDLFPRLQEHPKEVAPFRAPDPFGVAGYADNLTPADQAKLYFRLQAETKAINPNYNDLEVFPEGGFAGLGKADRARLIDDVLMDRAAAYYKMKEDPTQLQIETVRFLRKTVDHYYAEGVQKADAKRLDLRPSRNTAIGNYMDGQTRRSLQRLLDRKGIPFGPGQGVAINSRDYDTSRPGRPPSGRPPYRVPDLRIGAPRTGAPPIGEVRIGNITIDWTIEMKQPGDAQIQGFIHADSKPKAVIIIMPSQLYPPGARYIPRAAVIKRN